MCQKNSEFVEACFQLPCPHQAQSSPGPNGNNKPFWSKTKPQKQLPTHTPAFLKSIHQPSGEPRPTGLKWHDQYLPEVQKAALDCERLRKPNGKFHLLLCCIKATFTETNTSLEITYFLFRGEKCLQTQDGKGEPMTINLTVSEAHDLGPYKCKVQVANCSKYSHPFQFTFAGGDCGPFCLQLLLPGLLLVLIVIILILAFWMLPKYKARKAMKDSAPRVYGNTPMEAGIYANVCENQADEKPVPGLERKQCASSAQDGAEYSQEIQYAAPVFQQVAPRDQENSNNSKGGYVYSELVF
ncbi:hypothetical protein MJG53_015484 [Ovis ammon polii x Ovis aries]|uniref:Uncharacterized protein n=1 Tax=Ovis ammon polii x Ovis aries TaxID=2918886 RepID=A0ACB9UFB6_9CETA|nr:hypothetical protein MJG53_015484 [Ovis ammon polii x Ovis aries]